MRYLWIVPAIALMVAGMLCVFTSLYSPPEGEEQSFGLRVVFFSMGVVMWVGALATANLIDDGGGS